MIAKSSAPYSDAPVSGKQLARLMKELESQMKKAAGDLEFEKAAVIRDRILELKREQSLFSSST